jgi:hypothetical protein
MSVVAIKQGPSQDATTRTYERRRATLVALIAALPKAADDHHLKATKAPDLTDLAPRWRDVMTLGQCITTVGDALLQLGMTQADVDAIMKVQP